MFVMINCSTFARCW